MPDSQEELREAYKKAVSLWHPDRAEINGIDRNLASRNMPRVNQANALLKGIMLLRSESRLGRLYSDPIWGQHLVRDEYGYFSPSSPLAGIWWLAKGVMAGRRRKSQVQEEKEHIRETPQGRRLMGQQEDARHDLAHDDMGSMGKSTKRDGTRRPDSPRQDTGRMRPIR